MSDHRLVFVGGLHRSGTTPLTRCLAAHRQISGFANAGVEEDEGQHLQTVYPRPWPTAARVRRPPPGRPPHRELALLTPDTAARLLDQVAPLGPDQAGPGREVPAQPAHDPLLQGAFPDARFVMVVRHPAIVQPLHPQVGQASARSAPCSTTGSPPTACSRRTPLHPPPAGGQVRAPGRRPRAHPGRDRHLPRARRRHPRRRHRHPPQRHLRAPVGQLAAGSLHGAASASAPCRRHEPSADHFGQPPRPGPRRPVPGGRRPGLRPTRPWYAGSI